MKMKMVATKVTEHDVLMKPLDLITDPRRADKVVAHRAWAKGTWIQNNNPVPKPNPGEVWECEVTHFGLCRFANVPLYIAKPIQFVSADWKRYARILPML